MLIKGYSDFCMSKASTFSKNVLMKWIKKALKGMDKALIENNTRCMRHAISNAEKKGKCQSLKKVD